MTYGAEIAMASSLFERLLGAHVQSGAKERDLSGSPHTYRLKAASGAMFLGVDLARLLAIHGVGMRRAAAVADELADGRTVSLQVPSIRDAALFEEKAAASGVAATRLPETETR